MEVPSAPHRYRYYIYDLNAYNNVRDILYNTDVITNIVRSIVHSPVGKNLYIYIFFFLGGGSNITSM